MTAGRDRDPLRARVVLQGDPHGMHARPIGWVSEGLRGLEASVVFRRGGVAVSIRPEVAIVDLLQAACDLTLAHGAAFEIECGGPHAREAFEALRIRFTSGYFDGSEFTPLEPGEAVHVPA